jgi:hypothetical protein
LTFAGLAMRMSAVPAAVAALIVALLMAPLSTVTAVTGWWLPAAAALVGLGCLCVAFGRARTELAADRIDGRFHLHDGPTGATLIGSVPPVAAPGEPDAFRPWFGDFSQPMASTAAELSTSDLPEPRLRLLDHRPIGDGRRLVLCLESGAAAGETVVRVCGAPVRGYQLDGVAGAVTDPVAEGDWTLWCYTVAAAGSVLELDLTDRRPVTVRMTDRHSGLCDSEGMPAPRLGGGILCNSTFVSTSIVVDDATVGGI